MSAPQSVIHICSGVRLDNSYRNSIYFDTQTDQESYFAGKVVRTFSAYSYLRKTWDVKVEATMDQALTWEYLYFRNGSAGKIWYYFINQIEYVNDHTVNLSLEMDVIQSYFFEFNLLPCFVERNHTLSDNIGEHTVDEGLDVGELTVNGQNTIDPGNLCIMVMSSINPNATTEETAVPALPYMYNRVFSGVKIWAVNPAKWANWGNQLGKLDEIGKSEAIVAMWMYPMQLVKLGGGATWSTEDLALPVESAVSQEDNLLIYTIPKQITTIDGYVPKNNKLFCYPYNFAYCTNNNGSHAIYRYERFNDTAMAFVLSGSLAPDGGVHMTPKNYDGLLNNYNAGMNLTGFPTCAWNSDVYKLWLAQNQGQQSLGAMSSALKIGVGAGMALIGSVGMGTGIGAVPGVAGVGTGLAMAGSGLKEISGMLAQMRDKEVVPPQANGSLSSSVNITNKQHGFTFYFKSLTYEMARIIDDYFTMYGYKINRVQIPYISSRPQFTYVKTVGCNLYGDFPMEDQKRIRDIFDKGITFWKNGDYIGNYTLNNSPSMG